MAKIKVINIDIYKREILVFIGSHSELVEYAKGLKNDDCYSNVADIIINDTSDSEGCYYYDESNGCGIIELHYHPSSPKEIAVAAHECLHATMRVLSYIGIPCLEDTANETHTYLLEYLMEQVLSYDNYKLTNE